MDMKNKKYTLFAEVKNLERLHIYQPKDDVATFARYLLANVDSETQEYMKYFDEDSEEFAAIADELDMSKESLKQVIRWLHSQLLIIVNFELERDGAIWGSPIE